MSQKKMISIKNAITDAMEMVQDENGANIPMFTRWAVLAEKDIASYYQYKKKHAVLKIENCVACLPDDVAYLQRAVLGDYGCDCSDLFDKWVFTSQGSTTTMATSVNNQSFLIVDMGTTTQLGYALIKHEVQDNKIIFAQNLDGQSVTIQYLGVDLDCDGFLKISENHVQAITFNLCWKYFLRKKRKSNDDFNSVNKYEQLWHRECANSRARDGVMSDSDRERVVRLLHDPYVGIGLGTGMYTTLGNYIW